MKSISGVSAEHGDERGADEGPGRRALSASSPPGLPGRVMAAAAQWGLLAALAVAAAWPLVSAGPPGRRWTVAVLAAAIVAVAALSGAAVDPVRRAAGAGVLALLAGAPVVAFGGPWLLFSGFFAGGVLCAFKPVYAVPVALLTVAAAGFFGTAGVPVAALTAVIAAGVAGLGRLVRLAGGPVRPPGNVLREAVAEERQRFVRDTHDLLGLSLSAITLKCELVDRLIPVQPERARAELAEILTMARQSLAEMRSVAAGRPELSFDDEFRAAVAVLRAAAIDVTVERGSLALPKDEPELATTLATVLREAVTNVVRHSKATRCLLAVRTRDGVTELELVNDGVVDRPEPGRQGAGLRNLEFRVGRLGGELSAGLREDGTHRLVVRIPLGAAPRRERRRRRPGRGEPDQSHSASVAIRIA